MPDRKRRFPVFAALLFCAIIVFAASSLGLLNSVNGGMQSFLLPIMRASFVLFHRDDNTDLVKIKNENRDLRVQLVRLESLQRDNQALRDQFATTNPSTRNLVPASIVGMPTFLPGVSKADEIVIDKGSVDKLRKGYSVIYKDNLIGKVVKVTPNMSIVELVNHKGISFVAQAAKTAAYGIIRGTGEDNILFDNVLLSDSLKLNDMVITKDSDKLVVGKIVSINKRSSSLFQSAEIESLIDITKLQMVFVVLSDY